MIASDSTFLTLRSENAQPVSLKHAVRCEADAEIAVEAILSAMGRLPFGVSDALAIQMGVRETLHRSVSTGAERENPAELHVSTSLTPASIRIQIDDFSEPLSGPFSVGASRWKQLPVEFRQRLQLAKTYMTSIDVHQQGRRIVMYRARGQGSAVSTLPMGYDFQI